MRESPSPLARRRAERFDGAVVTLPAGALPAKTIHRNSRFQRLDRGTNLARPRFSKRLRALVARVWRRRIEPIAVGAWRWAPSVQCGSKVADMVEMQALISEDDTEV